MAAEIPKSPICGGSYSDADSGYDDLGVITIPVVRTVYHNGPHGNLVSTTSTEWISVNKKGESASPEVPLRTPCSSVVSLESPKPRLSRASLRKNSREVLRESDSSLNVLDESFSSNSNCTINSDEFEFDPVRLTTELSNETEQKRNFRLLAMPRDGRGQKLIPTMRYVQTVQKVVQKEETTKRVPRRKNRSKSEDGRKFRGSQNLFSPLYSKILSPESMRRRKMWADVVKKDCILEEEYYKVPYEACNREIILGRLSSPETLLYNFRRMKRLASSDNSENNFSLEKPSDVLVNQPDDENFILKGPGGEIIGGSLMFKNSELHTQNPTEQLQQLINDINEPFMIGDHKNDCKKEIPRENNAKVNFSVKTNDYYQQDANYNELSNENNVSTSKLVEQLIKDLDKFSTKDSKMRQKNNIINDNQSNGKKLSPLVFGNNEKKYSNNTFGYNTTSLSSDEGSVFQHNDNASLIVTPRSTKEKKKKAKKKVSFSNENEELVFGSSISDSDIDSSCSSVFEEQNDLVTNYENTKQFTQNIINNKQDLITISKISLPSDFETSLREPKDKRIGQTNIKIVGDITCSTDKFSEAHYLPSKENSFGKNELQKQSSVHDHLNNILRPSTPKSQIPNEPILNSKQIQSISHVYKSHPYKASVENANTQTKTKRNGNDYRENKVNIFMKKGPSTADHKIHLMTRNLQQTPTFTTQRIKVPFSSISEGWEWVLFQQQAALQNGNKNDFIDYLPTQSNFSRQYVPPTSFENNSSRHGSSSTVNSSGSSVDFESDHYNSPMTSPIGDSNVFPTTV